jgi:hypothetical protein
VFSLPMQSRAVVVGNVTRQRNVKGKHGTAHLREIGKSVRRDARCGINVIIDAHS